jgi:hypothetical protein
MGHSSGSNDHSTWSVLTAFSTPQLLSRFAGGFPGLPTTDMRLAHSHGHSAPLYLAERKSHINVCCNGIYFNLLNPSSVKFRNHVAFE